MSAVASVREAFAALVERCPPVRDVARRRAALDAFGDLGFPSRRDEEWRATSTAAMASGRYGSRGGGAVDAGALTSLFGAPRGPRFVFIDGELAPALSRLEPLAGVTLRRLADADVSESDLSGDLERPRSGFDALHDAFAVDGAVIDVEAGATIGAPIVLIHVSTRPSNLHAVRHVIRVGANADASVVEHCAGIGGAGALRLDGRTISVGAGARLSHVRDQRDGADMFGVDTVDVTLARDARYERAGMSLGGRTARETTTVRVAGPGAHVGLAELYAPRSGQTIDHHTCIDYRAPACTGDQVYKGVLDGSGSAVFNGKILVRRAAQQTSAEQLNQNLMLSRDARVDTKPQLEIFADDVRCTHGATVGQIDRDELFYLMSRAIPRPVARRMLVQGFAERVFARVGDEAVAGVLRRGFDHHVGV